MKTLVIAEHDNASLKTATLNAVAAANALGGDIDILVAGANCGAAAEAAAQVLASLRQSVQTMRPISTTGRKRQPVGRWVGAGMTIAGSTANGKNIR